MATINGKPSVFLSLDPPASEQGIPVPDYPTRIADHVQIATAMAESVNPSENPLDDPQTQRELSEWHAERDAEFRNDPEAQRQLDAFCDAEERAAMFADVIASVICVRQAQEVREGRKNQYFAVGEIRFTTMRVFEIFVDRKSLLKVLRQLWCEGRIVHRKDKWQQECFRLTATESLTEAKALRKIKAWCDAEERAAEIEAEAEAAELASLGVAGQHAIAGHDPRWQEGGA